MVDVENFNQFSFHSPLFSLIWWLKERFITFPMMKNVYSIRFLIYGYFCLICVICLSVGVFLTYL